MEATKKSKRKKISDHISYKEATRSETATKLNISNIPNEDILKNMILVAEEVFEPLREWAKHAINVNSFYRSPKLNSAVRGSLKSSHLSGQAIDISTLGKAGPTVPVLLKPGKLAAIIGELSVIPYP